jgi:flagellar biosynthesis protein FlhF
MEMYIEEGASRMECELKIAAKYNRPFHVLSQKEIRIGGFLGFFSKPGVRVEFYFSQPHYKTPVTHGYHTSAPWNVPEIAEHRPLRHTADLEEEKKKVIAAARKNIDEIAASGRDASQQILDSLNELKEKLGSGGKKEEHPAFVKVKELLKTNDFSESYTNTMIERLRKELPLEKLDDLDAVQDQLLEWIGESISIYKEEESQRKPRIMVLVGPTGVGKTTTISKLAAIYGIGTDEIPAIEVRMITIDAFRICAKEQLEQIGNIMQIPVSCVITKQELRKEIAIHSESTELFLIDTIGKSPKDSSKLGEMKEILDGVSRNAEFHLVISAATKTSDIEDIMRQFEPFNYKSIVLTKMDETDRIGNIISALAEKRKSLSYITDGQTVPVDIRRATVVRFLINLDGFKVNREKIEKRFPCAEADQFKWR